MPSPRPKLPELCNRDYDLLVVGGGINGVGVAREAAGRGLSVLLVEQSDYAFGASSRSTKLLHGGLRYLEHYDFALVGESLKERRVVTEALAPHLCRPLPFLLPVYAGDQRPAWMIRAGLWLYDLLALRGRGLIRWHRWLGPRRALEAAPLLGVAGLRGAAEYWDCQMDDARLVLENLSDAQRLGAKALNYCSLKSVHLLREGEVRARLRDDEDGIEVEARARMLVVAAGAWTDRVLGGLGLPAAQRVRPTKGIHLVTRRLLDSHALLVPARDGRVFFVIPWDLEGRPASLIGTTDTDFSGDPGHLRAEEDEIAYLLSETARVLPQAGLGRVDVWATYAGLRPLSAPPPARSGSTGQVSREHTFWEEPGLLAVTGGKYTTYRALCQSLVERAALRLGFQLGPEFSATVPLPGAPRSAGEAGEAAAEHLEREFNLEPEAAALLVSHYGRLARDVAELTREDPELKKPLAPGSGCPAILAMAAWAARYEQVVHLDDFYLRRTRLGLRLPPDHRGVDRVASVIGQILWWSRDRELEELERLQRVIAGEFR